MSKKALKAVYDLLIEQLGPPHDIESAADRGPDDYEYALGEAFNLAASFKTRGSTPADIVSTAWWTYLHPELLEHVEFDEINPRCQGGSQYELFANAFLEWKESRDE